MAAVMLSDELIVGEEYVESVFGFLQLESRLPRFIDIDGHVFAAIE